MFSTSVDEIRRIIESEDLKAMFRMELLTHEEEKALIARYQEHGDSDAGTIIIGAHLRMVVAGIAKMGIDKRHWMFSELFTAGIEGLAKTLQKFNAKRGARFCTYAMGWIRESISTEHFKLCAVVPLPNQTACGHGIKHIKKWKSDQGLYEDSPIPEELLQLAYAYCNEQIKLHIPINTVVEVDRLLCGDLTYYSLDQQMVEGRDSSRWIDNLPSPWPSPEELVLRTREAKDRTNALHQAMRTALTKREQIILTARKLTDTPITLEVLGTQFGISKERARQIEHKAMEKLGKKLKHLRRVPVETTPRPVSTQNLARAKEVAVALQDMRERLMMQDYILTPKDERPTLMVLAERYSMSLAAVNRLKARTVKRMEKLVPDFDHTAISANASFA